MSEKYDWVCCDRCGEDFLLYDRQPAQIRCVVCLRTDAMEAKGYLEISQNQLARYKEALEFYGKHENYYWERPMMDKDVDARLTPVEQDFGKRARAAIEGSE